MDTPEPSAFFSFVTSSVSGATAASLFSNTKRKTRRGFPGKAAEATPSNASEQEPPPLEVDAPPTFPHHPPPEEALSAEFTLVESVAEEAASSAVTQLDVRPQSPELITDLSPAIEASDALSPVATAKDGVRLAWEAAKSLEECVNVQLACQAAVSEQTAAADSANALAEARTQALKDEILQLSAEQERAVEREEFEEAARLDARLGELQEMVDLVSDTRSASAAVLRETQQVLAQCTGNCSTAVEKCISELQDAERACVEDAIAKVRFVSERTAEDANRLTFEAERLAAEKHHVESQLAVVEDELKQVEQKVDQLTEKDREVRDLAQEELQVVEKDIEQLKLALAEKEAKKSEIFEAIQLCDIRIGDARNKFQKQLHRLQTSLNHLLQAQTEVLQDIHELGRTKAGVLESRLSATKAVESLLTDATCVRLAAALLATRALAPLRLLDSVRKEYLAKTHEPNRRLRSAAATLSDLRAKNAATIIRLAAMEKEESQLQKTQQRAANDAKQLQEQRAAAVAGRHFLEAARLTTAMHAANAEVESVEQRRDALEATRNELQEAAADLEREIAQIGQDTADTRVAAGLEFEEALTSYRATLQGVQDLLKRFLRWETARSAAVDSNNLEEALTALLTSPTFPGVTGEDEDDDLNHVDGWLEALQCRPSCGVIARVLTDLAGSLLPSIEAELRLLPPAANVQQNLNVSLDTLTPSKNPHKTEYAECKEFLEGTRSLQVILDRF